MRKAGRIGMTFGVFDGLHEGHKRFLSSAQEQCDELYVAVADDEVVRLLKGAAPHRTLAERMRELEEYDRSLNVVSGDSTLGTWKVLRNVKPDIVFIGYDQEALKTALAGSAIPLLAIDAHEPGRFKSSLINGSASDTSS
jgi:cytidyltransferase-like protein